MRYASTFAAFLERISNFYVQDTCSKSYSYFFKEQLRKKREIVKKIFRLLCFSIHLLIIWKLFESDFQKMRHVRLCASVYSGESMLLISTTRNFPFHLSGESLFVYICVHCLRFSNRISNPEN